MSSSDSSSSPRSDQSPPEKKQKLEGDDRNDGERTLCPVPEDYSDDEHEITDAEFEQYCDAVRVSAGFDVPLLPGAVCPGLITPQVPLSDDVQKHLRPYCLAAMEHYNNNHGPDYEFLKLEKANAQCCRGMKYYLTFVGRNTKDNTTWTFQALVLRVIPEKEGDNVIVVDFCREKATPVTTDV